MPSRRIIAIWFPYMGAERILRKTQHNPEEPIIIVCLLYTSDAADE